MAAFRMPEGPFLHVLVTADTMSGSWTYARELVTGLVTRGVRVTLVTFGEIPLPDQTAWMDRLHGLEYRPTAFRLEWMDEAPQDLAESSEFLANLVREVHPDLLQLHQFCHGDLSVDVPRVVMAHGDLISWAEAVQGCSPRPTRWLKWYRETIIRGIAAADAVVAPSACMLNTLISTYSRPRRAAIIYPGRNPIFFNPYISKDDSVLSIGRLGRRGQASLSADPARPPISGLHCGSGANCAGSAHSHSRRRESLNQPGHRRDPRPPDGVSVARAVQPGRRLCRHSALRAARHGSA